MITLNLAADEVAAVASNNIIELNGKIYDATSGSLLGKPQGSGKSLAPAKPAAGRKRAKNIDGFIAPANHKPRSAAKPKPAPTKPVAAKPARPAERHQDAGNAARHKPEPSKTLMRTSLKKPAKSPGSARRANAPAGSLPARSVMQLPVGRESADEQRLARATKTPQSHAIDRFRPADLLSAGFNKNEPTTAVPAPQISRKPAASKTHEPSTIEGILAAGLARADSHNQPAPTIRRKSKTRRHLLTGGIIIVVVLAIVGFLTFEIPSLNLRIASMRAGITAEIPSYKPAGFALAEPIKYSPGMVSVAFHSSQKGNFNIVQQQSEWDDQSLRDEFVAPSYPNYQTADAKGQTVYLYGNGKATWVDGGIWYQITGNADLSRQQIIGLASSL